MLKHQSAVQVYKQTSRLLCTNGAVPSVKPWVKKTKDKTLQPEPVAVYARTNDKKVFNSNNQEQFKKGHPLYVSKKIGAGVTDFNPHSIFDAYAYARKFNIKMSMKDYMGVLWACANVDTSNNNHANIVKCKLAYMVYNTLKVEKNIPTDVFIKMMNICAKLGHGSTASMLYREFCSYGYKSSDSFMQDYVIAMARAVQVSWGQHSYDRANIGSSRDAFQEACATYRKLVDVHKWTGSAEVYSEIALVYSLIKDEARVLDTLNRMTELEHEPSRSFCSELFGSSLLNGDTLVLFTLANWYLDNFSDAVIEHGSLERLMHVASATGNVPLARLGIQLFEQCQYPITEKEYVCLIQAGLMVRDFPVVFAALQDVHAAGIDLCNSKAVNTTALTDYIVKVLSHSMKHLDDIYFGLVDLIRGDNEVPPLALALVIRTSGRMGNIDRAFATFQECYSLFALPKDIHMFNALLFAIAKSYNPILLNMLTVFQNMENAQVSPNSESFSILFEVMAELGDMQGCEDLIQHMNALNVHPSDRSLRRLCLKYAATHEPLGLIMVLELMRDLYSRKQSILPPGTPTIGDLSLTTSGTSSPTTSSEEPCSSTETDTLLETEMHDRDHTDDVFFTEEIDTDIFPVYFRKRVLYLMNNPIVPFKGKEFLPAYLSHRQDAQ